ncbi:MAG: response regulator transcription factor [Terriglobales bacterium]
MKTILIVDDNPAIRRILRALVERRSDWSVCGEAANGQEGVDQALRFTPDLIVLDLSMPVMNGFQAARQLRRLLPRVPILMFTTFGNAYVEKEAFAAGVTAVHSKSLGIDTLFKAVQNLLQAA